MAASGHDLHLAGAVPTGPFTHFARFHAGLKGDLAATQAYEEFWSWVL